MHRLDIRKFHYIYKTTRDDGRYYIGLHSTDDLNDGYLGSGTILQHSIRKYGCEAHTREILHFLPDREALKKCERELVNEDTLLVPLCMNIRLGGTDGGHVGLSEEGRARISAASSKRRHSLESKAKTSAKLSGRKLSPEHVANAAASHRGLKRTDEAKQKMSIAKLGKPLSVEHIINRSKAQSKKCTLDGVTAFPSVKAMEAVLGSSRRTGSRSPSFRFV